MATLAGRSRACNAERVAGLAAFRFPPPRRSVYVPAMIAHLNGHLAATGIDHAVIDVNGVGYLVGASAKTLAALGALGEFVTVHTEMLVAEDSIRLMGFASAEERDWFRLLTSVQGVGAKVALAILSILSPAEVQTAVARADAAMIARANGVGPKLAQRIVNELKDKAGGIALGGGAGAAVPASGAANDAVSALLNLGFKPAEASAAVNAANDELGGGASLDALVRLALRKAAK
jgi:Holliday junction DNA helicase RuvA